MLQGVHLLGNPTSRRIYGTVNKPEGCEIRSGGSSKANEPYGDELVSETAVIMITSRKMWGIDHKLDGGDEKMINTESHNVQTSLSGKQVLNWEELSNEEKRGRHVCMLGSRMIEMRM